MNQIRIEAVSGVTPISVFVADVYGNFRTLLGTITNTSVIPPAKRFFPPNFFLTAPAIMIILIDSSGCEKFQILDCIEGCGFDMKVELESCVVNIVVTEDNCLYQIIITEDDVCTYHVIVEHEVCSYPVVVVEEL